VENIWEVGDKLIYKDPNISNEHKALFSKLFPSLFICKKFPYNFDLVHSIHTMLCSGIGR
jgi:hypothetical protein